jgi:hypothetical protein
MDIILKGPHNGKEVVESLGKVLNLFKERYHINRFCEVHLTVTLVDEQGDIVELVDSDTNEAYRVFEVFRTGYELNGTQGVPLLQLVVDNTKHTRRE